MWLSGNALTHGLRRVLRIDSPQRDRRQPHLDAAIDVYTEVEPTVGEWMRSLVPSREASLRYIRGLLVFTQWLPRYNVHWLMGDSIAGVTVGFVVIPQAMAYALLATLSPEYGLYTSFVGAALYWLFGTSKDIVIGVSLASFSQLATRRRAEKCRRASYYRRRVPPRWISHHGRPGRTARRLQPRGDCQDTICRGRHDSHLHRTRSPRLDH